MEFTVPVIILLSLLAVSEVLGNIPAIKANSVFQIIVAILKALKELFVKKA